MNDRSVAIRYGEINTIQTYCLQPIVESFKSDQKAVRGVAPHVDHVFTGDLFSGLREKFDSTIDSVEFSCSYNIGVIEDTKAGLRRVVDNYAGDEKAVIDALKNFTKNEFEDLDDLEAYDDLPH